MNNSDGWTDVDFPAKRCRLSAAESEKSSKLNSNEGQALAPSRPFSSISTGMSSPAATGPTNERQDCKYGSNCYRRNENHLLQFRHRRLEDVFRRMHKANDFSKLPPGSNIPMDDESVILEQVDVLKNAGFELPEECLPSPQTDKPSPSTSSSNPINVKATANTSTSSESKSNATTTSSTPNPVSKKGDTLSALFEERRQRMKLKETIKERIRADNDNKNSQNQNESASFIRGISNCKGPKSMIEKWDASCPLNLFLTTARGVPVEKDGVLSATFRDLFDKSFGEVKVVCHINFQVEATWFFDQTMEAGLSGKPTWVIHGEDNAELTEGAKAFPWLKLFRAKSPFPYGHHHTKMSFVQYTDLSVRFFIYTANLVESDWDNRTQGIWISPNCPRIPSGSPNSMGESPTNFRNDILQYLSTYPPQASAAWKDVIKYADCSQIKVYFVGSAPITSQSSSNGFQFGVKKMEKVLRSYVMDTEPDWPLNVQCSSIGTLGASSKDWLVNEFGCFLSGKDRCLKGSLNLIYPTEQNVRDSFDGVLGGGCLPYSAMTHMKQKWLYDHLYQWKAEFSGRTRVPPHIKSYSRWSPDFSKMAWFLLTSANLSKAAWGKLNKQGNRLGIMSWEAGVLFIPELFSSYKYFQVTEPEPGVVRFPLYYDIPLVKYGGKDRPWFFEMLQLAISE